MKRSGTLVLFTCFALLLAGCTRASIHPTPAAAAELSQTYLPTVRADDIAPETVVEPTPEPEPEPTTTIPDTGQTDCYNSSGSAIDCAGSGQDGAYSNVQPDYTDNGDGTITDNVTGLMWSQSPDLDGNGRIDVNDKLTFDQALPTANTLTLAGYDDWRLPTITELYGLIDFSGIDPSGYDGTETGGLTPFIDTTIFDFGYGDTSAGERLIDAQFATSTLYVSTTMNGAETMFGVNFADGRIKGYPTAAILGQTDGKLFYVYFVRGDSGYDQNLFSDNGDGTISDSATSLMWQQADSGSGMDWDAALATCEAATTTGYDDWRLPNAKELQSLVDYTRAPDTTSSAAIGPLFNATQITNEAGQPDYAAYWSATTHVNMQNGRNAVYIAFGRAMGYMHDNWLDVHGAGAQRSDPKMGDASNWPTGHGPQGDAIRIHNFVRCVRPEA